MTAIPYFHVGFLVNDLDAGMERFGEIFKVTWCEPAVAHADFWQADEGRGPLALDVVYSSQGPPYIELLQAQGKGLYRPDQGEGFHHIGVWDPDCKRRQDELIDQGLDAAATQYTSQNEIIVSYFKPETLHGVMLEIVDEGRREMMEKWIAGEAFVD